jgi:hypothetical protein
MVCEDPDCSLEARADCLYREKHCPSCLRLQEEKPVEKLPPWVYVKMKKKLAWRWPLYWKTVELS